VLSTFSAAAAATLLVSVPSAEEAQAAYDAAKRAPVVPPGGLDKDHFSNRCTACQLCVSVCPTQVLQPATVEYGWTGVFQPRMDYNVYYCTFDCTACTSICPTGALSPLSLEEKHVLQIGKTTFVKADCIVETKKKDCGACAEHCPTKAVKMVAFEGNLKIPEVDNQYCVGCGACEHACPTEPRKAIYVTPHTAHQVAKKRPEERTVPLESVPEAFPF
jgi:ferredoxin-type protein NapF